MGTDNRFQRVDVQRVRVQRGDIGERFAAGMQELVKVVAEGGELVSPGRAGHTVVELLLGILQSQQQGNTPVKFPLPRD